MNAEQLERDYCASDGMFKALTHPVMKANFTFIVIIILVSYGFALRAIKTLIGRNIYSNCTRMILLFGLVNSMTHQTTMVEIRTRQIYRSVVSSHDPCSILFHSPECIYELYVYYITNFFSTYSVFSLTFDRLIAHFAPKTYSQYHNLIGLLLICIQLLLAVSTHLYCFYGISYAGYVPMCNYIPALTMNFDTVNIIRTCIMSGCIGITLIILYLTTRTDKEIRQRIFDTRQRYMAHQNVLTTKAVCLIIISQFACIMISSYGVTIIRLFEEQIPDEVYHLVVPFLPGVTYANLCLPVVIFFQTKKAIIRRKSIIKSMTALPITFDDYMESLRKSWL